MFLKQGIVHLKIFAPFFLSCSPSPWLYLIHQSPCLHHHLNTNTAAQRPALSPELNCFTHSYPGLLFVLTDLISIEIICLFSPTRIGTQTERTSFALFINVSLGWY